MRLLLLLGLAAILASQAPPPPRQGLKPVGFPPPAQNLRLWLPQDYEADPRISRRFVRRPSVLSPEVVILRLDFSTEKQPEPPPVPREPDVMKANPALNNFKFTGAVSNWRGRPVASVRYEGFVEGGLGVYGRMAWLPLEPGTVVVDLHAEPAWFNAMNQDWDLLLANLEGPQTELSFRERTPRLWLVSVLIEVLGGLVAFSGLIMILARMSGALGGTVVYLGLILPVVPIVYGFLHLHECWRGLLVFFSGAGLVGVSILMGR